MNKNEWLNPEDFSEFVVEDELDPSIPQSGPLFELFSEMLKIAQNHKLTNEEISQLAIDLQNIFESRSFSVGDDVVHTLPEGGLLLDPDDQLVNTARTKAEFSEHFDIFEPLVDGFSILVSTEAESGGQIDTKFRYERTVPLEISDDENE